MKLLCKLFGHNFHDWEYLALDSCEQVRICKRGGYTERRISHIWGGWEEIKDSKQERICTRNHDTKQVRNLEKCFKCDGYGKIADYTHEVYVNTNCSTCGGEGVWAGDSTFGGGTCPECGGSGQTSTEKAEETVWKKCSRCNGKGKAWTYTTLHKK